MVLMIFGYGCFRSLQNDVGFVTSSALCPVKDLPIAAKDVSFFLPGAFRPIECYDFTIDEASFRSWVSQRRARDSDIGPLEDAGFSLVRFNIKSNQFEQITVESGLVSHWERGEQGLTYGYDRGEHKAYYYHHSR